MLQGCVERCVLVWAGAFVSVDTFFFLSGFLAMLSQLEKYSITSAPVRSSQQIYNTPSQAKPFCPSWLACCCLMELALRSVLL